MYTNEMSEKILRDETNQFEIMSGVSTIKPIFCMQQLIKKILEIW